MGRAVGKAVEENILDTKRHEKGGWLARALSDIKFKAISRTHGRKVFRSHFLVEKFVLRNSDTMQY
jgi:hypothetical protein